MQQRRDSTKHSVMLARYIAQHHAHGWFVKVLDIIGRDAYTNRAHPIRYFRQLGT